MLDKAELNLRSNQVMRAVQGLSTADAMKAIGIAMQEVAKTSPGSTASNGIDEVKARMSRLKAERDPEVRDFILGRLGSCPVDDITKECKARFGSRAPGKSAIYTYIRRLVERDRQQGAL